MRGDAANCADYNGDVSTLFLLMKKVAATAENFIIGMGAITSILFRCCVIAILIDATKLANNYHSNNTMIIYFTC